MKLSSTWKMFNSLTQKYVYVWNRGLKKKMFILPSLSFFSPPHHLIFSPPHSHLFIFSIYHPLPPSPFFLSFIFFYHSSSPRESQRKKKIFFPQTKLWFLDSGKKKKNFTSNIPPIIFRNILASQYFPLLYFPRKEEKWSGIGFEKREATERRKLWKERERQKWDKSGAICKRRNAVGRKNTWPLYHIRGGLTATPRTFPPASNPGEIKGREISRRNRHFSSNTLLENDRFLISFRGIKLNTFRARRD